MYGWIKNRYNNKNDEGLYKIHLLQEESIRQVHQEDLKTHTKGRA